MYFCHNCRWISAEILSAAPLISSSLVFALAAAFFDPKTGFGVLLRIVMLSRPNVSVGLARAIATLPKFIEIPVRREPLNALFILTDAPTFVASALYMFTSAIPSHKLTDIGTSIHETESRILLVLCPRHTNNVEHVYDRSAAVSGLSRNRR
jgi:hypothetical protein